MDTVARRSLPHLYNTGQLLCHILNASWQSVSVVSMTFTDSLTHVPQKSKTEKSVLATWLRISDGVSRKHAHQKAVYTPQELSKW